MEDEKFWMVWNINGQAPTYMHPSEQNARLEAERLARANKGQRFVVLESKAMVFHNDVHWRECKERLPF